MSKTLESLHAAFCKLTGRQVRYAYWERSWYNFQQAGYTESDLQTVILFLTHENRKHDYKYSLKISSLIGDLAHFDELLAESLAVNRNRRPMQTPRQEVLEQFHPTVVEQAGTNVIPIKDALKRAVNGL